MIPEEAALFCSEKWVAARIRNSFDREMERRLLRQGLPEEHDVVRAIFLSSIECSDIHRRARYMWVCAMHIPEKTVRALCFGDESPPASNLAGASSSEPRYEADSPGRGVSAVPAALREVPGRFRSVHPLSLIHI